MISKSDVVIAVLTKKGARSEWVNLEIGAALGMNKPIVPLLEEGVEEPPPLKGQEYIRFGRTNIEATFESISKFIQKRMSLKSRKLAGLIVLVAGIAAVVIGLILLLYETKDDKRITKVVGNSDVDDSASELTP
jgi:hypothetical protein